MPLFAISTLISPLELDHYTHSRVLDNALIHAFKCVATGDFACKILRLAATTLAAINSLLAV
jgi:hypothetical protein